MMHANFKRSAILSVVFAFLAISCVTANTLAVNSIFQEVTADGNGDYRWNESDNWSVGIPTSSDQARIGDGTAAVECVIEATGLQVQWAMIGLEGGDPDSVLRIKSGDIWAPNGVVAGYSQIGHLIIEGGTLDIGPGAYEQLRVGGQSSGASGSSMLMTGGSLNVSKWLRVGIDYSSGGVEVTSGCVAEFSGGTITVRAVGVGSTDANDPGILKISGTANFDATGNYDSEIRDAILEVSGGNATINLGVFELTKSTSVLKLSGSGVSTINGTTVTLASGSILDVADLNVSDGNYVVINGTSITDNGLAFAAGTDANVWSFTVDTGNGDLILTKGGGPPTYTLTVNSGSGDGSYEADTVVNIYADTPGVGLIFDDWTGDTTNIDDIYAANTTITMPAANTQITATYADDPSTFALTVNSGSGDGVYDPNTVVNIYADPPGGGQIFDVWTGDTTNIADINDANTTITMPAADAAITATYMADPNAPTYTLTVNSGTGDGDYDPNTVVNIYADAPSPGWIFDDWTGDTTNVANVNDANTTVTMPAADTEVTATYVGDPNATLYKVTVVGGIIRDTGLTDGNFAEGEYVWIRADAPDPNMVFNYWVMTAGPSPDPMPMYKEEERSVARITMRDSPCTYEANYIPDTGAQLNDFVHGQDDGNGVYLWDNAYNWTLGRIPISGDMTEVGDNWAVVHSTIRNYDVIDVQEVEVAEYGMNDPNTGNGCSLTIEGTGSFSATGYLAVGKDKLGYLYMQPGSSANVGGVLKMGADWRWGRGIVEMDGAYLYAGSGLDIGSQDDPNDEAVGGSTLTATDSNLIFGDDMTIYSLRVSVPAVMHLKGTTVWNQTGGTQCLLDVDSVLHMEGGNLNVTVKNLDFNTPSTVLKLSGTGVSTISALAVTFANGSQLDVSGLNVSDGNYTVIDGTSISDSGLQFAAGTDANVWSFAFDGGNGDLILTKGGGGGPSTYSLTVNSGTGDGSYEEDTVVNIVADTPSAGDIFDVWTGDTTNVANVNNADTDITMPPASTTVTATYKDDPATYQLTVNNGTGDGYYGSSTVVNISADSPPMGKLFDMWTGDTTNVDDIYADSTTITMPAADSTITATYADDPNYAAPTAGYGARACGFDMDRDGIIGEVGDDDQVGDGVTTDPDGDGVDEDIIYVDASSGNDTTGDGSAGNPYKTIQKAFDVADGPGDGAEDIVAIYGTFSEKLTVTQSGVSGYYIRDNFQFPNNPMMLIGWDKDDDGEYPPYDADDEAIIDGNGLTGYAISNEANIRSYLEFAHFEARDWTLSDGSQRGFFNLCDHPSNTPFSHLYFHDLELEKINYLADSNVSGYSHVWNHWMGTSTATWLSYINNNIQDMGSWFVRGTPQNGSGNFRFQNLTIRMVGHEDPNDITTVSGFKLWEEHGDVEILDCIIDSQAETYGGRYENGPTAIMMRPGTQNYTLRGNIIINFRNAISIDGYEETAGMDRNTTGHIIDRNLILVTWTGNWDDRSSTQSIFRSPTAIATNPGYDLNSTIEDVTITNNFMMSHDEKGRTIYLDIGNDEGTQPGTFIFAGNTICGPGASAVEFYAVMSLPTVTYPQDNFVFKNNIIAQVGAGQVNMRFENAPGNWIANGNIYDPDGTFEWGGIPDLTFSQWQTNTGQDANSVTGTPVFVDEATGDLHIDPSDTLVEGSGVDITSITTVDYDGDARSSSTPWAGADVGDSNAPPTYTLTVNSGTGDGSYEEDTVVNIYADAPGTGQAFDVWTGDTTNVANVNDANTTVTMPAANVTITATYVNLLYALTVNDGTGGGNYTYNTVVNISAADPNAGQQFDAWTGDTTNVANVNDANTTITMPASAATVTATYEDIPPATDDYASSESTTRGTISGDYTDTQSSNDTYEALTEVVHGNRSKLEHQWTFSVTGGSTVTFYVEAYKAGTEDDFDFDYSTDGSNWTNMLTVTKTSDNDTDQSYQLPGSTSGTVYIRVIDTNRVSRAKDLDTIYVDHMYIRSE